MALREYSGTAKTTSLSGAISAAATTINVVDATGYPSGATGPFVVTIDAGVTTEEKVLCSGRTGNSLAVSLRGFDGTTASDHGNAAAVQHTISATDIREANAHVNDTTGDPHPQYLTPTEGAALYATGTHTHPAQVVTKTIRVPLHFERASGAVGTHFIAQYMPAPASQTVKLVKVRHRVEGSSVSSTFTVLRNGFQIDANWTGIQATTVEQTYDGPDVAIDDEDGISIQITAATGSPANFRATLYFDVTV